jgi:NadR type nicotinamide-nucleotide adenylyltransferase
VTANRLRRLTLVGAESTGKTTLAALVAARFGTVWVAEAAREQAEAKGGVLTAADVEPIARRHLAAADRAAARARGGLLVLDTDLVSTVVYARHYYGECPAWIEREAGRRLADLYLLCHPDIPWLPDPVRDRGDRRDELHELFRRALAGHGARVRDARGDWPAREAAALAAAAELVGLAGG